MSYAQRNAKIDIFLFRAFLIVLVWAPIPLGSNRPWAWAILEVALYGLAIVWLGAWAFHRVEASEVFRRARWVLGLWSIWLLYQGLYLIPLPLSVLATLSPETARAYTSIADFPGGSGWKTLSVDPHISAISWMKSLAYAIAFGLTLLLVNSRIRVKQLAYTFVFSALVFSIYGILMHLGEVRTDWLHTPILHGESASATYANRNHFAGYLEMTLAIGIGLLIASLRDGRAETWKKFLKESIELVFSAKIRLRLYLSILVIALVSTHSRMGNTAFFSSLLIAGAIGLSMSRYATRNTVILLVSLIAIDVFIVGSWFGVEKLAKRIEQTTMQEFEERQAPSDFVLQQIRENPWFGSGPNTFYITFPKYRGAGVVQYYDYAHNDYAQFAVESGLIGIGILGTIVVWCLLAALFAQWQRRDPLMRGMAFASIMGITAILIHSYVDFNLQIPANALIFVVLLALAWIALHLERHPSRANN